jgi:hypothetical protein
MHKYFFPFWALIGKHFGSHKQSTAGEARKNLFLHAVGKKNFCSLLTDWGGRNIIPQVQKGNAVTWGVKDRNNKSRPFPAQINANGGLEHFNIL